jgi:uncharacterized protein
MPATSSPLLVVLAAVGLSALGPAAAASFDCAKATTPVETAVCADPILSALDERVTERFAMATARSLDPEGLRQDQRIWLAVRDRDGVTGAPRSLLAMYRRRLDQLNKEIADLDKIETARDTTEAASHSACPALFDDAPDTVGSCEVTGFGEIGAVDGHAFLYGLYTFRAAKGDYPRRTSVVVYARDGDKLRALFVPREDESFYDVPSIVTAADRIVLRLPGHESGTGNFNRERLFLWRNGAWVGADVTSWYSDLVLRLPGDYEVFKGIFPDYGKMTAAALLGRKKTDGICCPTGGRVDMTLGWRDDRLIIESLQVKLGRKYAEHL